MPLRLYDTLTRAKREFQPVLPGKVGMYVCGMTVQDKPHVGHMCSSVAGDTIRRYLEHLGYDVTLVYNFTDVDDKIIERANAEHLDYTQVAERNIEAYLASALALNVKRATHYPRATRHIAEILDKASGMNPLWTPPWPSIEPSTYSRDKHPEYGNDAESKLLSGLGLEPLRDYEQPRLSPQLRHL